jgi:hypothetical protein
MEPPFSREAVGELRDATEWIYRNVEFGEEEELPDGTKPYFAKLRWQPWITECVEIFMDGDGTFRRFRYDLPYNEYPMIDMLIYRIIRAKIVEMRNADMREQMGKARSGAKRR